MTLGWKFPEHVFDLHTAYLAASNVLLPYNPDELRKKPRKRLPDACRAYGIEGWERIDKETIARDIGEGRWRDHGQEAVFDYCEEDVNKSVRAAARATERSSRTATGRRRARAALVELQRQGGRADPSARHADRHAAVEPRAGEQGRGRSARCCGNSIPATAATIRSTRRKANGATSDSSSWLVSTGVAAWPRLDSGQLDVDGDAFRLMYHVPGIEGLHALRDSLGVIVRAKLPIGRDGRNRPSLFPFCTATGRNAHAKSLYNAHAGMRSFMVFPEDTIGVYLDWRTQEVGIAAACSGDEGLMADYREGRLLRPRQALRPDLRPDPKHWKTQTTRRAPADEAAAARDQLRHGRAVPGQGSGSASTHRQ